MFEFLLFKTGTYQARHPLYVYPRYHRKPKTEFLHILL